ncbi:hypothetical protein RHMOL_Rhmol09G0094900 [Rhododendron molle]|uniref:Uncharacterized protein n=1 Tax=Rhododendron molle TaxID=49168 RepID=A0ACC0MBB5_RHOML|nr:hypothetical protein RHMOL_Rhmol09G0094900 [Rhododendron molle]
MNHIVNLVAGAHQLKITIESMTTQLMGKPNYVATILAEIRDFKRVQRHTPTPMEDDPWFPVMFPILCAFYGFFGALPPMENFTYGEEETGDEKVANEVTNEGEASGNMDSRTPAAPFTFADLLVYKAILAPKSLIPIPQLGIRDPATGEHLGEVILVSPLAEAMDVETLRLALETKPRKPVKEESIGSRKGRRSGRSNCELKCALRLESEEADFKTHWRKATGNTGGPIRTQSPNNNRGPYPTKPFTPSQTNQAWKTAVPGCDKPQKDNRDLATIKCYNCQNMGHYSRQCPRPQNERNGSFGTQRAQPGKTGFGK